MRIAFVFPGQGSQYVGMGRDLWERYPVVRSLFEEASEVLGFDLVSLCFEGPEEKLRLTENTQPAIFTVSVAAWRVLREEIGLEPYLVAGHSLGEYTALVASGALSFGEGVHLVRMRGKFMQGAVPVGEGGMAAVIGLGRDRVKELCERAADKEVLVPANFNSPDQIVISGHLSAVNRAIPMAKEMGAKRAVKLEVSAPFHSPLMESAGKRLAEELKKVQIKELKIPVVTNVEAEPNSDPSRVKELLVRQVSSPVLWEDSVRKMVQMGTEIFVEIGPKRVLCGLLRKIAPEKEALNFEVADDLHKLKEVLT